MREVCKDITTGRDAFQRVLHSVDESEKMGTRNASLPRQRFVALLTLLMAVNPLQAAEYPTPTEGDFVIRDFRFSSGETLPEVRMHYRTWGKPIRDDKGIVRNAVLILHGTTGSGTQFMRTEFAGELFGKGQLLDAARYFIV